MASSAGGNACVTQQTGPELDSSQRSIKGRSNHRRHVCGVSFRRHLKIHSRSKAIHSCPECHRTFKRLDKRNVHISVAHADGTNYVCSVCGKTFLHKFLLTQHMEESHSESGALACLKSFQSLGPQHTSHVNQLHGDLAANYCCVICQKSFNDKDNLLMHFKCAHQLCNLKNLTDSGKHYISVCMIYVMKLLLLNMYE